MLVYYYYSRGQYNKNKGYIPAFLPRNAYYCKISLYCCKFMRNMNTHNNFLILKTFLFVCLFDELIITYIHFFYFQVYIIKKQWHSRLQGFSYQVL